MTFFQTRTSGHGPRFDRGTHAPPPSGFLLGGSERLVVLFVVGLFWAVERPAVVFAVAPQGRSPCVAGPNFFFPPAVFVFAVALQ